MTKRLGRNWLVNHGAAVKIIKTKWAGKGKNSDGGKSPPYCIKYEQCLTKMDRKDGYGETG